jgi:hypothetical protein
MKVPFDMKKLALIAMKRQWVVDGRWWATLS